jgi:hypothetical protein
VQLELPEQLVLLVHKVHKVRVDQPELKVQPVHKVFKEQLDLQVLKDLQVHAELTGAASGLSRALTLLAMELSTKAAHTLQ